jgi:hypothetical protein
MDTAIPFDNDLHDKIVEVIKNAAHDAAIYSARALEERLKPFPDTVVAVKQAKLAAAWGRMALEWRVMLLYGHPFIEEGDIH